MQRRNRKTQQDAEEEKEPASGERGRIRDRQDRHKQRCFPCSLWSMMTRAPLTSLSDRPMTQHSFLYSYSSASLLSCQRWAAFSSLICAFRSWFRISQLFEETGDVTAKYLQLQQQSLKLWSEASAVDVRIRPQSWIKEFPLWTAKTFSSVTGRDEEARAAISTSSGAANDGFFHVWRFSFCPSFVRSIKITSTVFFCTERESLPPLFHQRINQRKLKEGATTV